MAGGNGVGEVGWKRFWKSKRSFKSHQKDFLATRN